MKYGYLRFHHIPDIGRKAAEHCLHILIVNGSTSFRKISFLFPFGPGHKAGPQSGRCKTRQFTVKVIGYTAYRLGRRVYRKHVEEIVPLLLLIPYAPPAFTGRHVGKHCVQFLIRFHNVNQIIVGFVGNGIFKKNGSRSNDPDYIPLNQAFGLLRVFQLLTDSHLVPLLDQPVNVDFRRMKRNAAHRHPSFGACVLPGQRELQLMGCSHCIVIKKFIEIAQAVKKKAVPILVLHLSVLFH